MPARKRSKPNPPDLASRVKDEAKPQRPSTPGKSKEVKKTVDPTPSAQDHGAPASGEGEGDEPKKRHEEEEQDTTRSEDQDKPESSLGPQNADTEMPDAVAEPRATRSWYGSWQRNPTLDSASIKSGKPSLSASTTALPAPKDSNPKPITPQRRVATAHLSPGASSRSLPLTATTRLNISSEGSSQSPAPQDRTPVADRSSDKASEKGSEKMPETGKSPNNPKLDDLQSSATSTDSPRLKPASIKPSVVQPEPPSSWTSWFGKQKPQPQGPELEQTPAESPSQKDSAAKGRDGAKEAEDAAKIPIDAVGSANKDAQQPKKDAPREIKEDISARTRSWLGIWSGGKAPETLPSTSELTIREQPPNTSAQNNAPDSKTERTNTSIANEQQVITKSDDSNNDSNSSWAFWSRAPAVASKRDLGELAVAGSSSQSQPENAVWNQNGIPKSVTPAVGIKRGRPASLETADEIRPVSSGKGVPIDKRNADLTTSTPPRTPPQRPVSRKDGHLLLPLFDQTYPVEPESPNILQQIGRLFYGKPSSSKYPLRLREPYHMKHALAIGIHGYFPTAFMQTVLGRPTGTSIKFAELAVRAIHNYAEKHQHSPISVEKIALEGEGRIEERLDILWKLLLNWIDKIRQADFIILACHSQGVPVAISLAAKLIGFGCVNGARIGICAMAGVNLGPFVDYKSRFIGGSAGELFEFARPDSAVSKSYEAALDTVLRFGGKVVYIGSMDDQLVSLQSSTFGAAEHPSIYRAVWIDGRVHVSDFLTHLVGFALKIRNLGVSDHGLVRELSNPLAGSLVGGEGHSRIYEDDAVYDLAVQFTAGTTTVNTQVLRVDKGPSVTSQNPYILPFAIRGVLEEEFVRTELAGETLQLLKQFDEWKPTTKVLRDVKYRLEGVRSKL